MGLSFHSSNQALSNTNPQLKQSFPSDHKILGFKIYSSVTLYKSSVVLVSLSHSLLIWKCVYQYFNIFLSIISVNFSAVYIFVFNRSTYDFISPKINKEDTIHISECGYKQNNCQKQSPEGAQIETATIQVEVLRDKNNFCLTKSWGL
jgi:hypothetical protein